MSAPTDHGDDCEGCAHLERISFRYKPPEVMLETGVPVACIVHKTNIPAEQLRLIAKRAGLVSSDEPKPHSWWKFWGKS